MTNGKYRAYAEYRDSEAGWLDLIPYHWKSVPLKFMTAKKVTDGPHETPKFIDEGIPFLSVDGIQNNQLVFDGCRYISAEDHKKYSIKCLPKYGDVLLGKAASVGKVAFVNTNDEFNVWSPLAVIVPKNPKIGKYLYYSFQSALLQMQCEIYSNSNTQKNLGMNTIDNLRCCLPTDEEAEIIANFLDHETAKIDSLIEKQQQLIKLLKEKRQAVISHAVTKGLNPNAPMRDSGVEWLGEVPAHWEVKRIGALFSESSARASSEVELSYPILSVSIHDGISDKELNEEELDRKVTRSDDKSLYKIVHENDLAYNMMRAWQGGFGASTLSGLVSPAYVVCNPKTAINSSYFELVLRTSNAVTELKRYSRGITDFRLRLYWDEFKNIRVPVPPEDEIDKILKSISEVNAAYDNLVIVAGKQIELLQERRTALISAAVTGKIDVRNWQAPSQTTNQKIAA